MPDAWIRGVIRSYDGSGRKTWGNAIDRGNRIEFAEHHRTATLAVSDLGCSAFRKKSFDNNI